MFANPRAPERRRAIRYGVGRRRGKALMLLLISLPAVLGVTGLVFDVGGMFVERQSLRQSVDAAALAAALDLQLGKPLSQARLTARDYLDRNGHAEADFTLNCPPTTGPYAGRSEFVEVTASNTFATRFMQTVGAESSTRVSARAVAGAQSSTVGAAVVALDSNPPPLAVNITLPIPLNYPALLGGVEVLGVGAVRIDGALLVNTTWGGRDENGSPCGATNGPPYGMCCTPIVPLTKVRARDIRVVGGVDNPANYVGLLPVGGEPLQANRLPVPDPFAEVPVPSEAALPEHVNTTSRGNARIVGLPLIGPPVTLRPGVYNYIEIISGIVTFEPGVYVIRGVSPLTGIALSVVGGEVQADGVLFYITNSSGFDATTAAPDSADDATTPSAPTLSALLPSVLINAALPGNRYIGLRAGASPLSGILIYQRRNDFRPIVIVSQGLLGSSTFSGAIYAKYGHTLLAANGTYDLRIVSGSVRFAPVLSLTLQPQLLLPPAKDVYLVE